MRPGDMRWRLTILRQVQVSSTDLNEPVFEWQAVRTIKAQKIHKSEDETFAADQRYGRRTVTFRTYYQPDIGETDRLRSDGVDYDVIGVRELDYRAGIEISAIWKQ